MLWTALESPSASHQSHPNRSQADTPIPRVHSDGGNSAATRSTGAVDNEAMAAWSMFLFNWRLLAVMSGIVLAWLVASQFYIKPAGYVVAFAVAALYWRIGLHNAQSPTRWNPRVSYCLLAVAQLILALAVLSTLTYLATGIGFPLRDKCLLSWDQALGFDLRRYLAFVNDHPQLLRVLGPSYGSIAWQLAAMVLILPLAGSYRRTGHAICAFMLALTVTTIVSVFIPAIGVYGTLGLTASDFPYFEPQGYYDTLRDAPLLRAGSLRALDLWQLGGVLTFPSFHAATAALYIWAFWPLVWLRLPAIVWNVAMIAATPLGGGHYLVDILAGIFVTTLAIAGAHIISDRLPSAVADASEGRRFRLHF